MTAWACAAAAVASRGKRYGFSCPSLDWSWGLAGRVCHLGEALDQAWRLSSFSAELSLIQAMERKLGLWGLGQRLELCQVISSNSWCGGIISWPCEPRRCSYGAHLNRLRLHRLWILHVFTWCAWFVRGHRARLGKPPSLSYGSPGTLWFDTCCRFIEVVVSNSWRTESTCLMEHHHRWRSWASCVQEHTSHRASMLELVLGAVVRAFAASVSSLTYWVDRPVCFCSPETEPRTCFHMWLRNRRLPHRLRYLVGGWSNGCSISCTSAAFIEGRSHSADLLAHSIQSSMPLEICLPRFLEYMGQSLHIPLAFLVYILRSYRPCWACHLPVAHGEGLLDPQARCCYISSLVLTNIDYFLDAENIGTPCYSRGTRAVNGENAAAGVQVLVLDVQLGLNFESLFLLGMVIGWRTWCDYCAIVFGVKAVRQGALAQLGLCSSGEAIPTSWQVADLVAVFVVWAIEPLLLYAQSIFRQILSRCSSILRAQRLIHTFFIPGHSCPMLESSANILFA